MAKYIQALIALEYLLDKAGETHWRDWLRRDIYLWESDKDVSHHLSAYGGMGSFNDIWICVQNGHNVTKAQEPWVHNLFEILKGVCFELAHSPEKDQTFKAPNQTRFFPILRAFGISSTKPGIDETIKQLSASTSRLSGWRCLRCGYGEITSYDIENYLAKAFLPQQLSRTNTDKELKELVDSAFTIEFTGISEARNQVKQMILNSNIKVADREGWMRPCPSCAGSDTAVYRWEMHKKTFKPSNDNLPLRKNAT